MALPGSALLVSIFIFFIIFSATSQSVYEVIPIHPNTEQSICELVVVLTEGTGYSLLPLTLDQWLKITPECVKIVAQYSTPSNIHKRLAIKPNDRVKIIETPRWSGINTVRNQTDQYITENIKYVLYADAAVYPMSNIAVLTLLSNILSSDKTLVVTGTLIENNRVVAPYAFPNFARKNDENVEVGLPRIDLLQDDQFITHTNVLELLEKTIPNPPIQIQKGAINMDLFMVRAADILGNLLDFDLEDGPVSLDFEIGIRAYFRLTRLNLQNEMGYLYEPRSVSYKIFGDELPSTEIPSVAWRYSDLLFYQNVIDASVKYGVELSSTHDSFKAARETVLSGSWKSASKVSSFLPGLNFAEIPAEHSRLVLATCMLSNIDAVQFQLQAECGESFTSEWLSLPEDAWAFLNSLFIWEEEDPRFNSFYIHSKASKVIDDLHVNLETMSINLKRKSTVYPQQNATKYQNLKSSLNGGKYTPIQRLNLDPYEFFACNFKNDWQEFAGLLEKACLIFTEDGHHSEGKWAYFRSDKILAQKKWTDWLEGIIGKNTTVECKVTTSLPLVTGTTRSKRLHYWSSNIVKI